MALADMKAALNITDSSSDTALTTLGLQLSDAISRYCNVPSDGMNPPTLLSETIVETQRIHRPQEKLILARHPVTSITSIVIDYIDNTETLTTDEYELHAPTGTVIRLLDGYEWGWFPAYHRMRSEVKLIITYVAGLLSVPTDLELAMTYALRLYWFNASRNPLTTMSYVMNVSQIQYRQQPSDSLLPLESQRMLDKYRYSFAF